MGSGQSKLCDHSDAQEYVSFDRNWGEATLRECRKCAANEASERFLCMSKEEYYNHNYPEAARLAKLASEEAFRGGDHERGAELLDFAKYLSAKAASVVDNLVTEK